MNLDLDENLIMLQETLRRFSQEQLSWELLTTGLSPERCASLHTQLADLGVFSLSLSEADGGFGFGPLSAPLVCQEIAARNPSLALYLAFHLALTDPRATQQPAAFGWATGLTEVAELLWTPDRTAPDSAALLTPDGILHLTACEITPTPSLGCQGLRFGLVPVGDGEAIPGQGQSLLLHLAAVALGICDGALEQGLAYAAEREQFGQPLSRFQGIQFKLADMESLRESARWLLYRASFAAPALAPSALRAARSAALFVTDEALQIHGGYGYTREYPVESFYRDAQEVARIADALLTITSEHRL